MPKGDYAHLIKLLLIGDSGVGKSCLLLRFSDEHFTTSFITTIGIDFKIKKVTFEDGTKAKLQLWDTAGQERFRTITNAYYRGAMGIVLTYDITDEASFANMRNWVKNIETNAAEDVNRILVGNKADMDESKRQVSFARGQALADEYGLKFFETSAKSGLNVEAAFRELAFQVKERLEAKAQSSATSAAAGSTSRASSRGGKSGASGSAGKPVSFWSRASKYATGGSGTRRRPKCSGGSCSGGGGGGGEGGGGGGGGA